MNWTLGDLGIVPNLSRLSGEMRDLIQHGNRDRHACCSEAAVAVCRHMLRAGYGIDELWMVLTDPRNAISDSFFSKDATLAEAWLEQIVSEAHEALNRSERDKSGVDLALGTHGDGYRI